jgi:hypothetical protein
MEPMEVEPTAQTSALALTTVSPNPDAKKPVGKRKLDLTFQEGGEGHGLLRFFSRVSREEYEQQSLVEFERTGERFEEARVRRQVAVEKREERCRMLARKRQQQHRAKGVAEVAESEVVVVDSKAEVAAEVVESEAEAAASGEKVNNVSSLRLPLFLIRGNHLVRT